MNTGINTLLEYWHTYDDDQKESIRKKLLPLLNTTASKQGEAALATTEGSSAQSQRAACSTCSGKGSITGTSGTKICEYCAGSGKEQHAGGDLQDKYDQLLLEHQGLSHSYNELLKLQHQYDLPQPETQGLGVREIWDEGRQAEFDNPYDIQNPKHAEFIEQRFAELYRNQQQAGGWVSKDVFIALLDAVTYACVSGDERNEWLERAGIIPPKKEE